MKKVIVWRGSRAFELQKMTEAHIKKGLVEARAVLNGYGARKDGGRAFTKTYSDDLGRAARCVEVFEAELSRRALLTKARGGSEKTIRQKSPT